MRMRARPPTAIKVRLIKRPPVHQDRNARRADRGRNCMPRLPPGARPGGGTQSPPAACLLRAVAAARRLHLTRETQNSESTLWNRRRRRARPGQIADHAGDRCREARRARHAAGVPPRAMPSPGLPGPLAPERAAAPPALPSPGLPGPLAPERAAAPPAPPSLGLPGPLAPERAAAPPAPPSLGLPGPLAPERAGDAHAAARRAPSLGLSEPLAPVDPRNPTPTHPAIASLLTALAANPPALPRAAAPPGNPSLGRSEPLAPAALRTPRTEPLAPDPVPPAPLAFLASPECPGRGACCDPRHDHNARRSSGETPPWG